MAAHADGVSRAHDDVSIALLRRLRAGAEIPYVHRADVCSAAPADLVADLTPAPGTDQTDDSHNSIWYFYCPKRYKNTRGDASGHRQRGIAAGGETRWHPEIAAKNVPGSEGGTFCICSYGRMNDGSLERLGWCMTEYDLVDKQTAATSNYVLCKVHRPSSRAKGKPSSCSSKSAAASTCSKRKRKAAGSDNIQARPAKLIHVHQEQQVQTLHDNSYPMPCYEQHHAWAPENYGEFVQTEYGPMPSQLAHIDVGEWIGCREMFEAEALQGLQQPHAEPEQGGEFIQMPGGLVVPAVAETTAEDVLGSETMPGECVSVQQASTIPDDDFFAALAQQDAWSGASSGQAPSWSMASSSSTGCSGLVQEPPLWLPYLMCP